MALRPADVRVIPAAAGRPKGLVLNPLDRFLFGHWLAGSTHEVHLPGAPHGACCDGGITDDPLHLPCAGMADGRVLYPHFQPQVVPGWLDKPFKHRHGATQALANVVVLSPSPEWVATLPGSQAARPQRLQALARATSQSTRCDLQFRLRSPTKSRKGTTGYDTADYDALLHRGLTPAAPSRPPSQDPPRTKRGSPPRFAAFWSCPCP